jgi:hypothetical protein
MLTVKVYKLKMIKKLLIEIMQILIHILKMEIKTAVKIFL